MRRTLVHSMLVVAAAAVMTVACGDDSTSTATPAGSLDGAGLYGANCASCHGADLRGTERGPSHLSVVYEPDHHPDAAFRAAIQDGAPQHHWEFGAMPPVDGLSDDDVDAIIAFVRAEQERQGLEQ